MVSPEGVELYVPPGVPVRVTGCGVANVLQNGVPANVIVAAGKVVIVTDVFVEKALQVPDAGIVQVTVYVPAVLEEGVIAPVAAFIESPAGALKIPPVVPVRVTFCIPASEHQGDPVYAIAADGKGVAVIFPEADLGGLHEPTVEIV